MSDDLKNKSAFPRPYTQWDFDEDEHKSMPSIDSTKGMTLLEYASIEAMKAMISNPEFLKLMGATIAPKDHCDFLNACAIEQATDMIEKLSKIKTEE